MQPPIPPPGARAISHADLLAIFGVRNSDMQKSTSRAQSGGEDMGPQDVAGPAVVRSIETTRGFGPLNEEGRQKRKEPAQQSTVPTTETDKPAASHRDSRVRAGKQCAASLLNTLPPNGDRDGNVSIGPVKPDVVLPDKQADMSASVSSTRSAQNGGVVATTDGDEEEGADDVDDEDDEGPRRDSMRERKKTKKADNPPDWKAWAIKGTGIKGTSIAKNSSKACKR